VGRTALIFLLSFLLSTFCMGVQPVARSEAGEVLGVSGGQVHGGNGGGADA
jgi:hypothetical protein